MSSGSSPGGSLSQRLLVGGGWSLLGRVGVAVVGLASSALLARLVPPADFGTYLLALSVVSVGALLAGLGLNQVVVRVVAQSLGAGRPERAWAGIRTMAWLSAAGGVTVALSYLAFGDSIAQELFRAPGLAAVTGLVAAWILILTLQGFVTEAHRGFGDIRSAAVFGGLAQAALLLSCLVLALAAGAQLTMPSVVLAALLCAGAGTVLGALALRRRRAPGQSTSSPLPARPLLTIAGPLLITSLLLVVFAQADLWVVSALLPEAQVAAYGAASRGAVVVGLPLLVVNGVVAPLVADLAARGDRARLQRALRVSATAATLPALAATALFLLAGGPLLGLVYGEHYASGSVVLALLALGQLACVATGSCGVVLVMTGRQRQLAWISLVSFLLTVPALLLLTRAHGTTGAAAATAGGYALQNLLLLTVARRTSGLLTAADPGEVLGLLRQVPALPARLLGPRQLVRRPGGLG